LNRRLNAIFPIKRTTSQMLNRFNVDCVGACRIDDGVRKTVEIELAVIAPDFASAFRRGHDSAQCAFILVKEVVTQPRLSFVVPERGSSQFLVRFRMADDAHEVRGEGSGWSAPLAGKPLCPPQFHASAGQ